ncbi:hypothetical protein EJ995_02095 [Nonlabens ponticola]|uniref:Uncharacterized protein n=1 Tax=Nonlabens ponticola TaxID=2496866 RepID=A0A3S9MV75_9FLAO|nr:hypothetical protein EJ995_02095 [Nonlabens ponticola]
MMEQVTAIKRTGASLIANYIFKDVVRMIGYGY